MPRRAHPKASQHDALVGGDGATYYLCKSCAAVCKRGFPHMKVGEALRLKGQDEGANDDFEEATTTVAGEPLQTAPESIMTEIDHQVKIKRRATILNKAEYQKVMGVPVRARTTRNMPRMEVLEKMATAQRRSSCSSSRQARTAA